MQKTFVSLPCVYRVFIVRSCTPADAAQFRWYCTRLYPCTHGECVTRTRDNMARIPRPPQCRKRDRVRDSDGQARPNTRRPCLSVRVSDSVVFRRSDGRPRPERGCPPSERNKGNQWAGEVSSRPSERRNRKINNQVRESERRTAQRIRAQSCSRVRPSNPWRNKRDPHLP